MKKLIALLLAAVMVLSLAACGGSGTTAATQAPAAETTAPAAAPAAAEPIALTLWGAEEDQALLAELVGRFEAQYPDQTFDIQIGVESESTAKDTVLTDVEAAADVFAFANDQLNDLIAAGALLALDGDIAQVLPAYADKTIDDVKAANGEGAVAAASKDGTLYAFPMGGGNNYFLYYDSTKVTAEQAQSWDGLLAAAEAAGSKVGMTFASGWYNASFFLGAGFVTDMNADGTTVMDWNGTSPDGFTGIDVVKGMSAIAAHPGFLAIADGDISNQIASGAVCAVVSGTWDAGAAETAFGEGYAATKLPTFTCADQQVQMSCYSGFKLMGVNAYSKNSGWAVLLAEFLTNEESQASRFEARQLAPTNLKAAENDAVTSNVAIAASAAQDVYGSVQNVGGKFWDPTATFGQMIANGELASADDAAIQAALDTLVEGVTAPVE
ncbi:MAG: extracellular solute-binding protein [Eubacteriales bacterium]|nr:extracellular solute-binding protein [Eubacteriales bacterium]